jgi:hypothetical protein
MRRKAKYMATFVGTEFPSRELDLPADHSSCGGRSVAADEAALLVRDAWRRDVRRRILEAQLSRLLRRLDDGPSAADTADRAARLAARLERDDFDW